MIKESQKERKMGMSFQLHSRIPPEYISKTSDLESKNEYFELNVSKYISESENASQNNQSVI